MNPQERARLAVEFRARRVARAEGLNGLRPPRYNAEAHVNEALDTYDSLLKLREHFRYYHDKLRLAPNCDEQRKLKRHERTLRRLTRMTKLLAIRDKARRSA